ncbi:MAG: ActS/PrrB/RegB family redox-sensitive histidine kinase [Hyphomicrobiaceae bacterium]
MPLTVDTEDHGAEYSHDASQLRLLTTVRLRWIAVVGQLIAVVIVAFYLQFPMPIGWCLGLIAVSAWLNVFLAVRYPPRHKLTASFATVLLTYDLMQLAGLLYLTGGIENPFMMLIMAPVTVSAATLRLANTVFLGLIAIGVTIVLVFYYEPLPWEEGLYFQLPYVYKQGLIAAVSASVTFLAFYSWRLAKERRQMSAALSATELILAREQRLHALDGLAAAAAHELGTPLSTISVIAKELEHQFDKDDAFREDVQVLRDQAERCREILKKLTKSPGEQDPMHASISIHEIIDEAALAHQGSEAYISVTGKPLEGASETGALEPVGQRRPGVIFGIGNIIENAVDFADRRVDVEAQWDADIVSVTISDDGPGFALDLIDSLGEPYVTSRPDGSVRRARSKGNGLGLGFFIAKTLLERSGAVMTFDNRPAPLHGAIVQIVWPRGAFEAEGAIDTMAWRAKSPRDVLQSV